MSYKDSKYLRRRKWERRKFRGNKKKSATSFGEARLRITPKLTPTNTKGFDTSTVPECDESGMAKGVDMAGVYVAGAMFLLMAIGICYGVASAIFE